MRRTMKGLAASVVAVLILAGASCSNWERTTFQSLSTSKAVLDQAQIDYEQGTIPHNETSYMTITQAKATQASAVNALVVYESLKGQGASSTTAAQAQSSVNALVAQLPPLIASVKGLYSKGVQP